MRLSASVIRILAVLGFFVFASPALRAQGNFDTPEDTTNGPTVSNFGQQIAGTYLAVQQPTVGATRILNLFADGNLTSMLSFQFSGESISNPNGNPFSNQHGTWIAVGGNKIVATVLSLEYDFATGKFVGTGMTTYNMQFDNTLQTVTGTVTGQAFAPGVDPLNPGSAKPIREISNNFQAKRVTVGNSGP